MSLVKERSRCHLQVRPGSERDRAIKGFAEHLVGTTAPRLREERVRLSDANWRETELVARQIDIQLSVFGSDPIEPVTGAGVHAAHELTAERLSNEQSDGRTMPGAQTEPEATGESSVWSEDVLQAPPQLTHAGGESFFAEVAHLQKVLAGWRASRAPRPFDESSLQAQRSVVSSGIRF